MDSRARPVLVAPLSSALTRPDVPLRPLTVRQKWRQAWISMQTSLPHYMTFHKCRNPQSYIQGYPCQMVCLPFLSPLDLVTDVLVWSRSIAQAPSIANPSEKSQSRCTFGGLTETLGYTWGAPQSRWTHRDIPPKSVSHSKRNFAQLRTDLLIQFAVVRLTSTDKILAVFSEVSFGSSPPVSSHQVTDEQQSSELQAEKRGNFVVVGCIEGSRVVSWSLNVSISYIRLKEF